MNEPSNKPKPPWWERALLLMQDVIVQGERAANRDGIAAPAHYRQRRLHEQTLANIAGCTDMDELDAVIEDHGAAIAKLIRRDQADADRQDQLDVELGTAIATRRLQIEAREG